MDDRLYRSVDDRILAGVAGGVAERLDADPSIIRIVWAMLIFLTGGIAFVAYIVMAIVVPEGPPEDTDPTTGPGVSPDAAANPVAGAPPPDLDAPTATTPFMAVAPVSASEASALPSPPATPEPGAVGGWVAPNGQTVPRASGPATSRRRARAARRDGRGPLIGGLVLILIGGFFLLRQFIPAIDLGSWWPIILVAIGAILVIVSVMPDRKSG